MKKFLILVLSGLFVVSCKYKEKPKFLTVDRIELGKVSLKEIDFEADAVFTNGNDIGGKLVTDSIHIYIDNILVGHLKAEEFKVPARDTFMIPLQGKISTSKIFEKKGGGLLNNILSIVQQKKVEVKFEGDIIFKKGPFSYSYKVDKTEKIDIKL